MNKRRTLKGRKGRLFSRGTGTESAHSQNLARLVADSDQDLVRIIADSDQDLEVTLINDFAFKHVFHNKKALTGLLSALLDIPPGKIVDLELLDTFQPGSYEKDKTGILDIKVHLNNSQKINIELQVRQVDAWKERSLFYLSRMYAADIASGEDYSVLESCIHISIIYFEMPELTRLYSVIRLIEEKTKKVYSDKISLRVLYLKKLDEADETERQTEVYRWAKLITAKDWEVLRDMAMQDEYKAEAVREMEKINADRALRYEYISREIARIDAVSYAKDKERFRIEQEEFQSRQEEFQSKQEEFQSKQEEFQSKQEEFRFEQEEFQSKQEEFQSKQEEFQSKQEEFQSKQEEFQSKQEEFRSEQEEFHKFEREMKKREEAVNQRERAMQETQIKLQLARHMMAAGETELFLKLESDPQLFRKKVREYHLDT